MSIKYPNIYQNKNEHVILCIPNGGKYSDDSASVLFS